ncbi:MAG: GxxExxY protein [Planctomycetales bacterium]|nr:GxxExxY protein [Planctomycetales bacterium]
MSFEHTDITGSIIGAAFEVHNSLGYGFLEKVYQNAMQVELIDRGHDCRTEAPIKVHYKNAIVGQYFPDLLVDDSIIVELKVARTYQSADEAQLLNALKAARIKLGLLMNFGRERVEFKRMVM